MNKPARQWTRRELIRRFGLAGASAWAIMQLRPEMAKGESSPPRRFVSFFMPEGVRHEFWRPRSMWNGDERSKPADLSLSETSFGDFRNVLSVILQDAAYADLMEGIYVY